MSANNGWDEHKLHVLKSLERLEAQGDRQETVLAKIENEMCGFKASQKWEVRIMSAVWGGIIILANWMWGSHNAR